MTSRIRRRGALSGGTIAVLILVAGLALFAVTRFQRAGGVQAAPAQLPVAFASSKPLEAATADARATGKPMLLFFTADWCPPCKSLKKNALSEPTVADAFNARTVPVYVDCTNDVPAIGRELNIEGFPTLILVRNGKEVSRVVGALSTSELLAWLDKNAT
jgi:protein disulfide-isomerase